MFVGRKEGERKSKQLPVWRCHLRPASLRLSRTGAGEYVPLCCLSICLCLFLSRLSKQAEPLPWWWGVGTQKWEAGSLLWDCVEMDINQDNGPDSLGHWLRQKPGLEPMLGHVSLGKSPHLCASVSSSAVGIITPLHRA